jgi:CO dehydrogenase nickel-insertion accessory protein CooC1
MRDKKGRLIAVWVPGNHGAGGSTIANCIGITLQHISNRRTLIVNMGSPRNFMEQYLKNDVDIRFSMDYLRSFNMDLSAEHIKTYATSINDLLCILPNCRITSGITKVGEGFYQRFIEKALEAYEIVIVDLETGINKENQVFLNSADMVLAVMNENELMLKEIFESSETIQEYVKSDKAIPIFNGLHITSGEVKTLKRYNDRLGLKASYGISYDIKTNKAACSEGKMYSFLKKELNKRNSYVPMVEQMRELSGIIAERLLIPLEEIQDNNRLVDILFPRRKHWGEIDV